MIEKLSERSSSFRVGKGKEGEEQTFVYTKSSFLFLITPTKLHTWQWQQCHHNQLGEVGSKGRGCWKGDRGL